jgi:hypothetical protein
MQLLTKRNKQIRSYACEKNIQNLKGSKIGIDALHPCDKSICMANSQAHQMANGGQVHLLGF